MKQAEHCLKLAIISMAFTSILFSYNSFASYIVVNIQTLPIGD